MATCPGLINRKQDRNVEKKSRTATSGVPSGISDEERPDLADGETDKCQL